MKARIFKYIIIFWRLKKVTKNTMKVVKGVTAGVALGALAGYVGRTMNSDKRHMKKKANKAMETMSDVMDTVSYMFK